MTDPRRFQVSTVGIVGRENAVFTFCEDLNAVDALQIGDSIQVWFRTGMGTTLGTVRRLPDGEVPR